MHFSLRTYLCFSLLSWSVYSLSGQSLGFFNYSLEAGLPQTQTWAALSDHQGYLWFGTQGGGLARYDGQDFNIFNSRSGLATDYVHCLFQSNDQRIWAGTSRGLSYYSGGRFKSAKGGKHRINCLTALNDGHLIVGTNAGIFSYNSISDSLEELSTSGPNPLKDAIIYQLLPAGPELLIGTGKGLFRRTATGRIIVVDQIPRQPIYALAINQQADACWLAIYGDGLIKLSLPGLQPLDNLFDPVVQYGLDLMFNEDGSIWVATRDEGISLIDPQGEVSVTYTERNGLPHNHARQLVRDVEGALWVATSGGGVARCLPLRFRHYNRRDGLKGDRIYAVHRRQNGGLLLAVSSRGVQEMKPNGQITSLDLGPLLNNVKCKSIVEDQQGRIYIGTEGQGLGILDSNQLRTLNRREGLPGLWIRQLAVAPDGQVWIATFADGLARLRWRNDSTYQIRSFGKRQQLPSLAISSLAIGADTSVWVASTEGQISHLVNERVVASYGAAAGLPNAEIRAMVFDDNNRLWVAVKSHGIYWADISSETLFFNAYTDNDQLASTNIYLLQSSGNELWAGSATGLDLLDISDSESLPNPPTHYGREEGFLGVETCHAAVSVPDSLGQIWFGTMNGLMAYRPGLESRQVPPPKIHFQEISLFYRPIETTDYAGYIRQDSLLQTQALPYHQNSLSFSYQAVDLTYPDRIRYRFRLTGEGRPLSWSPANRIAEVSYADLSPGRYTFAVQATNDEVRWSTPLYASFMIAPPLWDTNWFRWTAFLLGMGLITLISWLIIRRIKRREAARRQQLEVDNKLLQLEQKALQLQMNPHFIFNALTSIRGLVGTADADQAKTEISNFAALMRGILNNSRQESISLAEEIKVLDQYLRVEQFCQPKSFSYTIQVKDLDTEEIELPPMLLQPFVENAVVHGIAHLNRPGQILIECQLNKNLLTVKIQDNGIGREAAGTLKRNKRPGHQSVALTVTKERLLALRGNRKYQPLTYRDLYDDEGNIAGTAVLVILPVEAW